MQTPEISLFVFYSYMPILISPVQLSTDIYTRINRKEPEDDTMHAFLLLDLKMQLFEQFLPNFQTDCA